MVDDVINSVVELVNSSKTEGVVVVVRFLTGFFFCGRVVVDVTLANEVTSDGPIKESGTSSTFIIIMYSI